MHYETTEVMLAFMLETGLDGTMWRSEALDRIFVPDSIDDTYLGIYK